MHQTGFWKPIRRIQQRFCKNKGEFCVCMCCLKLRSRQKCSVLLLPGFIFHTSLQVSCVKGNRQHSVLVISQRLSWNTMSNNSAFLWLKVLKSSNMGKVECVCGGALRNQRRIEGLGKGNGWCALLFSVLFLHLYLFLIPLESLKSL